MDVMSSTKKAASSSCNPLSSYVCMSTVDDLSYTPSPAEKERDAAQVFITGRKSWKTIKGKGEAVWPSYLEAALFEALRKYQPDNSKTAKLPGRFPMRNKFISDYIYEATGKRRTPRQVGSRLQQLRDTCGGKQLLDFHSHPQRSEQEASQALSSDSRDGSDSPTSSQTSSPQALDYSPALSLSPERLINLEEDYHQPHIDVQSYSTSYPPHVVVNIDILPTHERVGHDKLVVGADSSPLSPILDQTSVAFAPPSPVDHYPSCSTARPIRTIDPAVTFASPGLLCAHSSFSVFCIGSDMPVHTEVTPLVCCSPSVDNSPWLYGTTLVPNYWENICQSNDPTIFTIQQDIVRFHPNAALRPPPSDPAVSVSGQRNGGEVILTTIYQFKYPMSAMSIPPHSSITDANFHVAMANTGEAIPFRLPGTLVTESPDCHHTIPPHHFIIANTSRNCKNFTAHYQNSLEALHFDYLPGGSTAPSTSPTVTSDSGVINNHDWLPSQDQFFQSTSNEHPRTQLPHYMV